MERFEYKSKHLWPTVEKFTGPESEAGSIPKWAARAMLEDLQALDTRIRELEAQPTLVVNEYLLKEARERSDVVLRRMPQRDGSIKWAIYDGDRVVLSKEYEDGDPWEFEPLPSSRDDEYLARCRYDTIEEALQHWHKWLEQSAPQAKDKSAL